MKTKKCGVFAALAAVLLVTAALIVSCVDPVDFGGLTAPQEKEQPAFTPPPGKGLVLLNFAKGGLGRTIRPDTSDYTSVSSFALFDVTFSATNSANDASFYGITSTRITEPFVLEDDETYSISVWAYDAAYVASFTPPTTPTGNEPTKAIAFGTAEDVLEIETEVATQSAPIVLKEILDGAGTGTFTLALTGSITTPFTAFLTIKKYPGGDVVVPGTTGVAGQLASGYTVDLPSGYYSVSLALAKDGYKSVALPEILYIYQGMTSPFSRALPVLSPNQYTVTWVLNGGSWGGGNAPANSGTVDHGSKITRPASTFDPTKTNWTFDDWYTTASGNIPFDFDEEQIRAKTVYAQYTPDGIPVTLSPIDVGYSTGNPPTFTVTYVGPGPEGNDSDDGPGNWADGEEITSGTIFYRAYPPEIRISVVNTGGNYSGFVWWLDGAEQAGETNAYINLDFNDIMMKIVGGYEVHVYTMYDADTTDPDNPIEPEASGIAFTVSD